jgi:hypothetical protein
LASFDPVMHACAGVLNDAQGILPAFESFGTNDTIDVVVIMNPYRFV